MNEQRPAGSNANAKPAAAIALSPAMLRRLSVGVIALGATLLLQLTSLTSLGRMLDAITATHPAMVAAGESFGGALRVVRVLGLIAVPGVTVGVSIWKRALPLGDVLDRALLAVIGTSLGTLLLALAVDSLVAGDLRSVRWGVGDLPLVLLNIGMSAGVLFVAVQRSRWLANVRRGLDKRWTIEPVRTRADELHPLLAEQERGDGVLMNLVVKERAPWESQAPAAAVPIARVDYVDARPAVRRHWIRGGVLLISILFGGWLGLALATTGVQAPRVSMLATPNDATAITYLAVPEEGSSDPRIVKTDGNASAVNGPIFHTNVFQLTNDGSCLLDRDGQVFCRKRDTPGYVQVKGVINASMVASRGLRGCALLPGGVVRCWRDPSDDPMVAMHASAESQPVRNLPPQQSIAVGDNFACGVSFDRRMRCWVPNGEPFFVDNVVEPQGIAIGTTHACAIQRDNSVVCWGKSEYGATLSNASAFEGVVTAVAIPGVTGAVQLAAGATHSCARTGDGKVLCWGFLTSDTASHGVREVPLSPSRMIAAGDGIVCSLENDRVACLGDR